MLMACTKNNSKSRDTNQHRKYVKENKDCHFQSDLFPKSFTVLYIRHIKCPAWFVPQVFANYEI